MQGAVAQHQRNTGEDSGWLGGFEPCAINLERYKYIALMGEGGIGLGSLIP